MSTFLERFRFEEIKAEGLDPIHVYWRDIGPGQGSVVIECWGAAWAWYWGGMGECSIREFFARVDARYLVEKLGHTPFLMQRKRDKDYLARIIVAVRAQILSEVPVR